MPISFDAADAGILAAFGEDVTYTSFGNAPAVIKGFFQAPDDDADTIEIEFQGNAVQVRTLSTDTPTPLHEDLFTIRGVDYTVKQVEVDESLFVVFHLLEA